MVSEVKRPVALTPPNSSCQAELELCGFQLCSRECLQDQRSCSSTGMGNRSLGMGDGAPLMLGEGW